MCQMMDSQIEKYCLWLAENEKSRATIEKYRRYLQLFQAFVGEKEVTKEQVLIWKNEIKESYSAVTVNVILAALNGFFRYYGWNDCISRPMKVKRNFFCPEQKELSREEYMRLTETAYGRHKERLAYLLQTICSTGIRVSELKYITVEGLHKQCVEVEGKGKTRTIFLTEDLCRMLKGYADKKQIKSGMIFITRTGKPLDRSNIWRELKGLGAKADVPENKIYPHNFRHLFARSYYSQEKDLNRLADILGHSNINTTRIYTMESGENHRKQLENLKLTLEIRNTTE